MTGRRRTDFEDHLHHELEGRRREDRHRHQPGGGPGRPAREAGPAHRRGPSGQHQHLFRRGPGRDHPPGGAAGGGGAVLAGERPADGVRKSGHPPG